MEVFDDENDITIKSLDELNNSNIQMEQILYNNGSNEDNEISTIDSEDFCNIIRNFCDSLIIFTKYVVNPTVNTTMLIKNKYVRHKTFDTYVVAVNKFNEIMISVVFLIKKVIIALNKLFITKNPKNLVEFIEGIRIFLIFLLEKNVFDNLYELKYELDNRYMKNLKNIKKLADIKYILFRICNISIDITCLFIPPLTVVKEAIAVLEDKLDINIENNKKVVNDNYINLDNIIRQLIDIQLRVEVISIIKNAKFFNGFSDNETVVNVHRIIENLQTEYVELHHIIIYLRSEINIYKQRKLNILSKLFQKITIVKKYYT
jgi:hypothetical protein